MKKFFLLSALLPALAIASTAYAGPGPTSNRLAFDCEASVSTTPGVPGPGYVGQVQVHNIRYGYYISVNSSVGPNGTMAGGETYREYIINNHVPLYICRKVFETQPAACEVGIRFVDARGSALSVFPHPTVVPCPEF
jgi:hypothetical protein